MRRVRGSWKGAAFESARFIVLSALLSIAYAPAQASVVICSGPGGPCGGEPSPLPSYTGNNFLFSQSGFPDGLRVTGHFKGIDQNNDGVLDSSVDGEVSQFFITYEYRSLGFMPDLFTANYLERLVYVLGSPWLGDDPAEMVFYGLSESASLLYLSGLGALGVPGGGLMIKSTGSIYVTDAPITVMRIIPEPSTMALFGIAAVLAGWRKRT